MAESAQIPDRGRSTGLAWTLALAIPANIFVIVTVNFWIYYARAAYIAAHPEKVALSPPTISRAIADPVIGEPFAFWITLSAVVLAFGVFGIGLVYWRIASQSEGRARIALQVTTVVFVAAQASSSVGMYLLSSYRFPHYNGEHMVGSILFFVAQALVIVFGVVLCTLMLRTGFMRGPLVIWRRRLGFVSIALSLAYMALFFAKGMEFAAGNAALYLVYVLIEPVVITSFLLFLAMFQPDLWAVLRNRKSS